MNRINLLGKRFGKLVVIARAESSKCYHAMWVCRCDCGKETTETSVKLRKGIITDCGCTTKRKSYANNPSGKRAEKAVSQTISPSSKYVAKVGDTIVAQGDRSTFDYAWRHAQKEGVVVDVYQCSRGKIWLKIRSYDAIETSKIVDPIRPYFSAEW